MIAEKVIDEIRIKFFSLSAQEYVDWAEHRKKDMEFTYAGLDTIYDYATGIRNAQLSPSSKLHAPPQLDDTTKRSMCALVIRVLLQSRC